MEVAKEVNFLLECPTHEKIWIQFNLFAFKMSVFPFLSRLEILGEALHVAGELLLVIKWDMLPCRIFFSSYVHEFITC